METTWKYCIRCGKNTLQSIVELLNKNGKTKRAAVCPCGKSHYVAW